MAASVLTFHPPPPFYEFECADGDGKDEKGQVKRLVDGNID